LTPKPKLKDQTMHLTPAWEYVSDTVMGGVSSGEIKTEKVAERLATRLTGRVSLQNNGGFLQMAFDLHSDAHPFNASEWSGIEIDVYGNGEAYDIRLRTDQLARPWQSYRTAFIASETWTTFQLPFDDFEPHRTEIQFDPHRLKRIGILAIGRVFDVDIAVSAIKLYRDARASS